MRSTQFPTAAKMSGEEVQKGIEDTMLSQASGKDIGELFQYSITSPVSVAHGKSAIVPILSCNLPYQRELVFNQRKMEAHPIACLRLKNSSDYVLEGGPVTVVEDGQYLGEAVLPYTPKEGDIKVSFAEELGVKVAVVSERRVETRSLSIKEGYFQFIEWEVYHWKYRLQNTLEKNTDLVLEHTIQDGFELFDSSKPFEQLHTLLRYKLSLDLHSESTYSIKERRVLSRREDLQKISLRGLKDYLEKGLLERDVFDKLHNLFFLWEKIDTLEKEIKELDARREKLYRMQEQIQANLRTLSKENGEGELRSGFVQRLADSQANLDQFDEREKEYLQQIESIKKEVAGVLETLEKPA